MRERHVDGDMKDVKTRLYYLAKDVKKLSASYFKKEGPHARGRLFSNLWLSVGFQFRHNSDHTVTDIIELLGDPDLGDGNKEEGMIGWLLHSRDSDGSCYDYVVGYAIQHELLDLYWSNSVKPVCSPVNVFAKYNAEEFMMTKIR